MATSRIPNANGPQALSPDSPISLAFQTGRAAGLDVLEEMGLDTGHPEPTRPVAMMDEKKMKDDKIHPVSSVEDEESVSIGDGMTAAEKVDDMEKIGLYAIHIEDDPNLNPWTFRTFFLGIGLSCFSAVLATIYQFKPQGISLSATFLCVISYVLGLVMERIPRVGFLKWLNPHPFNAKEHVAILIMSSTAAHAAEAITVIAVQKLWYNETPKAAVCIFLVFSSQILGYGIAGLMRRILVYPTKFVYPSNLPIVSLLETLHRKRSEMRPQIKLFYIAFVVIFVWEVIPEYVMPLLTAVSVFCLAKRDSMVFTNIFGGGNGNEGLGFLSLCFDFNYIGSAALYLPAQTQFNTFLGYLICTVVFAGIFYGNVWRSQDFPFLSQLLFLPTPNNTNPYVTFNQTAVLGPDGAVDETLLAAEGLPYMAGTFASYVLTQNLAITATITHILLYNWKDVQNAFSFLSPRSLRGLLRPETYAFWRQKTDDGPEQEDRVNDPHYRLLRRHYRDTPDWWYLLVLVLSAAVGLVCIHEARSGMSWWAFLVAGLLAAVFILFMGAQAGLTGFHVPVQPIIQMIGAYLEPGRPVTNMYFTLFGYNSVSQGLLLLGDLKLGQYAKLSPRVTFTMQMAGTFVGAILNYFIMDSITTAQRDILLSVEGTNIWSGASLQSFNTQAITWGGLAKFMYSWGSIYEWVPLGLVIGFFAPLPVYALHRLFPRAGFDYINVAIVAWHIGWLVTGINSSIVSFFAVAYWSQFYLRRYHPDWFLRFNYVLAAGLDGGTQVIIFILSFAVFGASGNAVTFPSYWGNNGKGNIDYCMVDPRG